MGGRNELKNKRFASGFYNRSIQQVTQYHKLYRVLELPAQFGIEGALVEFLGGTVYKKLQIDNCVPRSSHLKKILRV